MSESKFYHFSAKGLFYGVATLNEAMAALREDGFVWLNYFQPEREDLSTLVDTIGIHPLSVEDCFDEDQVPKIEYFSNNTFIIFNSFTYKEKELLTDEVNLFIGKNFLITVTGNKSKGRRPLGNIDGIIANDPSNASQGPAFLMHRVLDFVVDQKYNLFDTLEDELEEAEESLLENVSAFQPMDLIGLRRNLVRMRKTLFHEREILVKINRMDCPFIPEKALAAYRDVYDHLAKFFDLTETYREIESSLMELYTSLLNYHMTKVSNETNSAVRRLTLIATIFMPLTLLAGIGGMSEWTMMTGPSNWRITYPLLILGMIIIAGINYFLIRRLEKRGVAKRKFTGED
jgi:magnesium transporter